MTDQAAVQEVTQMIMPAAIQASPINSSPRRLYLLSGVMGVRIFERSPLFILTITSCKKYLCQHCSTDTFVRK